MLKITAYDKLGRKISKQVNFMKTKDNKSIISIGGGFSTYYMHILFNNKNGIHLSEEGKFFIRTFNKDCNQTFVLIEDLISLKPIKDFIQ